MRDLNLGPDTRKMIERYNDRCKREAPDFNAPAVETLEAAAHEMAAMLKRWMTIAWCWTDACPATICGGPHVRVVYEQDALGFAKPFKRVEVIEPYNKIGTTFKDVPFHVIAD
jgi:hypothetical protein